jgi:hypothetical protein
LFPPNFPNCALACLLSLDPPEEGADEGGEMESSSFLSLVSDVEKSSSESRRSPLNFGGRDLHTYVWYCVDKYAYGMIGGGVRGHVHRAVNKQRKKTNCCMHYTEEGLFDLSVSKSLMYKYLRTYCLSNHAANICMLLSEEGLFGLSVLKSLMYKF